MSAAARKPLRGPFRRRSPAAAVQPAAAGPCHRACAPPTTSARILQRAPQSSSVPSRTVGWPPHGPTARTCRRSPPATHSPFVSAKYHPRRRPSSRLATPAAFVPATPANRDRVPGCAPTLRPRPQCLRPVSRRPDRRLARRVPWVRPTQSCLRVPDFLEPWPTGVAPSATPPPGTAGRLPAKPESTPTRTRAYAGVRTSTPVPGALRGRSVHRVCEHVPVRQTETSRQFDLGIPAEAASHHHARTAGAPQSAVRTLLTRT